MRFRGGFRVVRRSDRAVPLALPPPLPPRGMPLDIRIWAMRGGPLLLVNAGRKAGGAVARNRFRRRVRMAFLQLLREGWRTHPTEAVVWIRPARGAALSPVHPSFREILDQLCLVLRGPGHE